MWTKEMIRSLLLDPKRGDEAVERAVTCIYNRQTREEQSAESTLILNNVGFRGGPDARRGTYFAKWIASGKHLTGNHLVKARAMMLHYTRQLAEVANQRSTK